MKSIERLVSVFFIIDFESNSTWKDSFEEVKKIITIISEKKTRNFLFVIFLVTLTPSLASTFNFYYTVELKFELAWMSKLSLAMSIAYFLSIVTVNFVYQVQTFKPFFMLTGFIAATTNLSLLFVIFKYFK